MTASRMKQPFVGDGGMTGDGRDLPFIHLELRVLLNGYCRPKADTGTLKQTGI